VTVTVTVNLKLRLISILSPRHPQTLSAIHPMILRIHVMYVVVIYTKQRIHTYDFTSQSQSTDAYGMLEREV